MPKSTPLMTRIIWYLKRYLSKLLGYSFPCSYVLHRRNTNLEHGYLLMKYV